MKDDWRLQGYRGKLKGKVFELKEFHSTHKNDHEHCEFCGKKITDLEIKDADKEGYVTYDEHSSQTRWICESCFKTFAEKLNLLVKD